MIENWPTTTIGEISEVVTKGTTPTSIGFSFVSEGINFIKVESLSSEGTFISDKFAYIGEDCHSAMLRSQLKEGDILFSIAGALGRTAMVSADILPANINQALAIIRLKPSHNIFPEFVLQALSAGLASKQIEQFRGGVAQQNLSLAQIKNFIIPLPPLAEQKRIVAILGEAFAGIAAATANAEKNLANARELFECVLQATFTQGGDGWLVSKLSEVCTLRSGTTVDKSLEKSVGDLPYLKVADMTLPENSDGVKTSSRFLNIAGMNKNNILPKGTVIFPKRGGAILTNKKRLTEVPICTDLNIMGVIPSDALLPEFLFMYFLTVDMRTLGSGSSIPQINNYDIEPMTISYPESLEEQRIIVRRLDNVLSNSRRLEAVYKQKLADLTNLKQSILQKAFAGELTAQFEQALRDAAA